MKTVIKTFTYLTLFMLGWNLGVTLDNESTNFNNVYLLWGLLLGLILLRVKIINY